MAKKTIYNPAPVIAYQEPWGEFTLDAPVKVTEGFWAGKKGMQWTFVAHCTNLKTGSEWLDVRITEPGYSAIRAMTIGSVELIPVKVPKKRGRPKKEVVNEELASTEAS